MRIEGRARGQTVTGSGFVTDLSTVVISAQVIAGLPRPRVITSDDRRLTGQVVLFDDNRDLAREMPAVGRDIYGDDLVRRRVLVLASHLSPGDSGGPLADRTGQVVGVAFAGCVG